MSCSGLALGVCFHFTFIVNGRGSGFTMTLTRIKQLPKRNGRRNECSETWHKDTSQCHDQHDCCKSIRIHMNGFRGKAKIKVRLKEGVRCCFCYFAIRYSCKKKNIFSNPHLLKFLHIMHRIKLPPS